MPTPTGGKASVPSPPPAPPATEEVGFGEVGFGEVGFGDAAAVLRELGAYEQGVDPRRAAISLGVAGLLDACARAWPLLPPEVAREARTVVRAVDRAAGLGAAR